MSPVAVNETLKGVLSSRVYDVAIESPLQFASKLSNSTGRNVYLKREDLQPVHSFKLRGAYNKISNLTKNESAKGVITSSAGNHAQGVALSAQKLGIKALIVMPSTTPTIKVEAVKSFGADVELYGDSYSDAAEYCNSRVQETGMTFIPPYDDPEVIAGQGTIGREIIEQLPESTHIFVPVGGGGLIAGIATYIKAIRPDVKIICVEPEESNAMQLSVKKNKRIELPAVGIFADGVAVKKVGEITFEIARNLVDDFITVNTDQICAAIKCVFEDTRSIVEPAGALAAAGIQKYELPDGANAVAICSGANVSFERLQQIAERTLIGSGREAMFAVTMPEKPGALYSFCNDVVNGHNISGFNYRLNKRNEAHVLVSVNVSDENDKRKLMGKMRESGFKFSDLSNDELAKTHTRHMVGGNASKIENEHLYEVVFPERPGALEYFLGAVGTKWNISLFHYKSAASDSGKVLIGFEAPDQNALEVKLTKAGFSFKKVDENPGLMTFLK